MAIITISRGSYSMGKNVAEKVAERLGYDVVSRDVLLDASDRFKVPEIKLVKAIHDAPGILERYRHGKQSYVAYVRAALTQRVAADNIVYHGLAGHLLLKGIPHVLKVRINANLEQRVENEMRRENISAGEARERLLEDDRQRRKWTKSLYGEDPWDSALYDLTVCIDNLSIEDAVDFICRAAESEKFKASEKHLQKARDLAMACMVKAAIVNDFPDAGVTSEYGNVLVYTDHATGKLTKRLNEIRDGIEGLYSMEVHAGISLPPDAV